MCRCVRCAVRCGEIVSVADPSRTRHSHSAESSRERERNARPSKKNRGEGQRRGNDPKRDRIRVLCGEGENTGVERPSSSRVLCVLWKPLVPDRRCGTP